MNETEATELVAALFDRWYSQLVRYAARSADDYAVGEDLVQDAFAHLYSALRSGKRIEVPKAWLMCVLRRSIGRHVETRFGQDQLESPERIPNQERGVTCLSLIEDYLHVLSRREEEVLLLRLEAMKYKEIAEYLGISPSSVNTILARALQKLKKAAAQRAAKESEDLHEKQTFNRAS